MPAAIKDYLNTQSLLSVQMQLSTLFLFIRMILEICEKANISLFRRLYNLVPAHIGEQIKYAKLDPETRSLSKKCIGII